MQLMGDTLKDRITIDPPFKAGQPRDEMIDVLDARKKISVKDKLPEK
jgi:hypothetical protein